jgi:8-oxo-dGTP diphosphatase
VNDVDLSPLNPRPSPPVNRTTVGIILVNATGQILMQLRDDIPTIADPGCWVVPGGVVDPGETPEDGARRELLEETGYRAGRLIHAYERVLDRSEGYSERQHYYVGRYDELQSLTCYEGQELRFQDRATLVALKTSPDLAGIILDCLARVPIPDERRSGRSPCD